MNVGKPIQNIKAVIILSTVTSVLSLAGCIGPVRLGTVLLNDGKYHTVYTDEGPGGQAYIAFSGGHKINCDGTTSDTCKGAGNLWLAEQAAAAQKKAAARKIAAARAAASVERTTDGGSHSD